MLNEEDMISLEKIIKLFHAQPLNTKQKDNNLYSKRDFLICLTLKKNDV